MTIEFLSTDTKEQHEEKLKQLESLDRITTVSYTITPDKSTAPAKSPEELVKSNNPFSAVAAQLYLRAKESNAARVRIATRSCGVLENADVFFMLRFPDDDEPCTWRERLTHWLQKLRLIEDPFA